MFTGWWTTEGFLFRSFRCRTLELSSSTVLPLFVVTTTLQVTVLRRPLPTLRVQRRVPHITITSVRLNTILRRVISVSGWVSEQCISRSEHGVNDLYLKLLTTVTMIQQITEEKLSTPSTLYTGSRRFWGVMKRSSDSLGDLSTNGGESLHVTAGPVSNQRGLCEL